MDNKGFSLVEMIVSLCIFMIIATMAVTVMTVGSKNTAAVVITGKNTVNTSTQLENYISDNTPNIDDSKYKAMKLKSIDNNFDVLTEVNCRAVIFDGAKNKPKLLSFRRERS